MQANSSQGRIGTVDDFNYEGGDEETRAQFKKIIVEQKCIHSPPYSVPVGRTADRERGDTSALKAAFIEARKMSSAKE